MKNSKKWLLIIPNIEGLSFILAKESLSEHKDWFIAKLRSAIGTTKDVVVLGLPFLEWHKLHNGIITASAKLHQDMTYYVVDNERRVMSFNIFEGKTLTLEGEGSMTGLLSEVPPEHIALTTKAGSYGIILSPATKH